jgi:hypothetical protein
VTAQPPLNLLDRNFSHETGLIRMVANNRTRWRILLLLPLLPFVLLVFSERRRARNEQFAAKYQADMYAEIAEYTPDYVVERILGGKGIEVSGPEWPSVLGEIPGHEMGIQQTINISGGTAREYRIGGEPPGGARSEELPDFELTWVIEKSRPLRWVKWSNLPGHGRWIAVAFMVWGEAGGLSPFRVVAKRMGGPDSRQ